MITVVRHGRTEANRSGLLLGRLDVDLDDVGRVQAAALADAIDALGDPVDRLVASPLRRTQTTASTIAARVGGIDVAIDDRWIELDYGALDGTPAADVPASTWARWQTDLGFVPAGGESLRSLGERVSNACEDLMETARDHHVVVVTHVSPIKAAMAWALGVAGDVAWRSFVAPASITRIAVSSRGPSLHAFNVVSHLEDT